MFVALALLFSSAPTIGWVSEEEQRTKTNSERYVVPDGDATELVEFIQRLSQYQPVTTEEDLVHRSNLQPALKQAVERIIVLENDQTSTAYEVAKFILLVGRVRAIDYVSSTKTKCRPFCVAMTVEVPHRKP